jgi:hypothetical protein
MRLTIAILVLAVVAGCVLIPSHNDPPPPAPGIEEARELLDEVIETGIARDFERLCANATGTCEGELEGFEERAPTQPPAVVDVEVHEPVGAGDQWTSGGVLFVLCGTDGLGDAYESEVLVIDGGDGRLIATAAVYWTGTGIEFTVPGQDGVTVGVEPSAQPSRC